MAACDRRSGARGRVEILRDRAGVPHVYAASTPDLFFGLGVAMAQDRLWQMDRLRRRALGRQAEILGPAYLASDVAHLTVGIDLICRRARPRRWTRQRAAIIDAFVAGINRQIELFGADLPIEFQVLDYPPAPFTVRDVVAIGRGIWWSLNGRIDRLAAAEAARLLPTEALRTLYLTPEASENLVVPCCRIGGGSAACGRHRRCDRQQQLGVARHAHRHRPSGAVRRSAPAVLGAVELVRIRAAWTGGRCRRRRSSGASRHVVGQQRQHRLEHHQQRGVDARSVCRGGRIPSDPTRYRDGDTWREFDERARDAFRCAARRRAR